MLTNPNSLLILMSTVPLAYATKSLIAPSLFFFGLLQIKLWKVESSPEECLDYIEGQKARKLREQAQRREVVLKAIIL